MSVSTGNKINQMLQLGQKNGLLFAQWLTGRGYSSQLLKRYRISGWLTPLCRGVMYRTGDNLSAYGALQSFNEQLGKKFRIAAHSALELWGFNHYVPMGKPLLVITATNERMPQWMKLNVFDRDFHFFKTDAFMQAQITTLSYLDWNLLASTPEQAFMECLLLSPRQYNYMDLYYIMEQLTTLRSEVVQSLLETTKNYKMKRLFLYMAEKANHYWFEELDLSRIDLGTTKLQLVKSGVYLSKYKMTIPKELNDYE
ncbi:MULTISPECIES: type IV toxin-antitoxin system AbiEi family antitoxin domain-containing protein [Bacteroidales]|jgi:hypothetical protein|uniref:Type IV toxin-antitoxin system AbiEi family antitoxin n=7 Tax=Bacteroidales TaxID=171549 RepID=A0A9D6A9F1_9BACT|nr:MULTISPECIES: type IV toxin-antitoxin system AbiEi family antitoxin domain-containing protein [Bacteroidales]MBA7488486.1 type IV toxin-antitoxin system AbiEi family antitoxin [Prevotella sp.]MDU5343257.1 type IV toxin-antitoxin system AbiEi family antitoxin domain-containing protein [Prevotella bivia]BES60148.1 type IV toxin-antitoxin system AbiEi family antitoxin [Dysgonomonas capnocytophagoides]ALO48568.1 hypothetical protein AS203_05305 [Hoylesella enoeca]AVM53541.1 hypothetical protein